MPYIVLAAEAAVVVAFLAYTLLLTDLHRDAQANPVPKGDATSRSLVGGVQIAFAVGLVALVALTGHSMLADAGLIG